MKFKDKTVGGYPVKDIECYPELTKLYCVNAVVSVNTEWLILTFTKDGILNINRPDSKFNLVKEHQS